MVVVINWLTWNLASYPIDIFLQEFYEGLFQGFNGERRLILFL